MSLADSFLADLEDIEGFEAPAPVKAEPSETPQMVPDFPTLLSDASFCDFMTSIEQSPVPTSSMSRSSPDFILISKSNIFLPQIDAETHSIYKYVADVYAKRFPELEQIVLMPFEYLRVVGMLQNNLDLSAVDLSFLPTNLAVAVTVTASTSRGLSSLTHTELETIQTRIQAATRLQGCRDRVLKFLSQRMPFLAPNLSALLGAALAAQLVAAAGGVENLATMPSQNIEAVGAHKQSLAGLSAASQAAKVSIISQSDLVLTCPNEAKKRAVRLVMGKTAIAARVDQFNKSDTVGATGTRLRAEIIAALEKATELPPARAVKPLPLPAEPRKNKRGGARARKWKETNGVTELQKRADRVAFGNTAGDIMLDGTTAGSSLLHTQVGAGRIRSQPQSNKRSLSKPVANSGSSGNGLAFTASHGVEISLPPNAPPSKKQNSGQDLFSSSLGFNVTPSEL